jgi:hypothetical protein
MSFTLRVHEYAINQQTAERELVSYRPLLRLGCSSADGYSGEIVYLQGGCVYGEGGAAYAPKDLPAWFAGAIAAVHPQALADVGFTPDVVSQYCWHGQAHPVEAVHDQDQTQHANDPPMPAYPPGFKPDHWILGWLCKRGHDYQRTGHSRYDKAMRCVDCHNEDRAASARKRKEVVLEKRSG